MDNKEKSIWDWLYQCPYFHALFFAFGDISGNGVELDGQVIYAPEIMVDERFLTEYIDGGGEKQYVVNIAQYFTILRQANSAENINIMQACKDLRQWILNQADEKKFPQFESNDPIQKIQCTGVTIAGVDESGAKCQFQVLINYLHKKE